jgi:ribosome-associated translation inhibitor RaiA
METPVQITFKDLPVSDAIERVCLREAEKLERYRPRITGCHVVIAKPHRHHQKGNLFEVHLNVVLRGGEVVVNRMPPGHASGKKLELAIREAFDRARRQLQDDGRIRRGAVKQHSAPVRVRRTRRTADEKGRTTD